MLQFPFRYRANESARDGKGSIQPFRFMQISNTGVGHHLLLRTRDADVVQPTPRPQFKLLSERPVLGFPSSEGRAGVRLFPVH